MVSHKENFVLQLYTFDQLTLQLKYTRFREILCEMNLNENEKL